MEEKLTKEFIEKVDAALKNARSETLQELFELGKLSNGQVAGEWTDGQEISSNTFIAPYYAMSNHSNRIMKILYELNLVISFDWMNWDEGREFISNKNLDLFSNQSKYVLIGLLTALARNDRFCDGAWGSAIENGTVAKLLDELEKQLNEK